jgi:hypothetical protein
VIEGLNTWLGRLFAYENVVQTVAALVESQGGASVSSAHDAAKKRLDAAEAKLRRLRAAIEAGVEPAALVEAINDAQAQRAAARTELERAPERTTADVAEVYARIDSLSDRGRALNSASPEKLQDSTRNLTWR